MPEARWGGDIMTLIFSPPLLPARIYVEIVL